MRGQSAGLDKLRVLEELRRGPRGR
jgi:hypothetical protein